MIVRTQSRMRLCVGFLALNLLFIWGNSMLPASVSSAISQWVKSLLWFLFEGGTGEPGGDGYLRKLAHFLEFTSLGFLFCWLFAMLRKLPVQVGAAALVCGFLAACVDESIQLLSPGRNANFLDVLLDTSGVALGIALLQFGYYIRNQKQ